MQMMLKSITAALVGLLAASGAAHAQSMANPSPGGLRGSLNVGTEFFTEGDVHGAANVAVADFGALGSVALAGQAGTLNIGSRTFEDIYSNPLSVGFEVAYGLSPSSEVFGELRYVSASSDVTNVGTATVTATATTVPVTGDFGDFRAFSLEGGYRKYFQVASFNPYVAGRLGIQRTESVDATFRVADVTLSNVKFWDDSTTWLTGVDVGVLYAPTDRFAVGLETGIRYTGEIDGIDSDLAPIGLGGINDDGAKVSIPLNVKGSVKF
jgi:hypothetical protein